jgi:NAD(P)-dependent dehydrogenase (short-subunit alcohol dehydrogenase family)
MIRGNCLYNASKSALSMLTKTAALECGAFGVRTNYEHGAGTVKFTSPCDPRGDYQVRWLKD